MGQSSVIWLLSAAAAMLSVSVVLFLRVKAKRRKASMNGLATLFEDRNLTVMDLGAFPKGALALPTGSPEISRLQQLALDSGKAVLFHPGKTVEVVFKPEIRKGLQDGSFELMKTKQGELLADAVNPGNGQIVGKGRLIEAGKVRQLAAASFQLVSIAVAQAHLAEIAEGMRAINAKLDSIANRLEANDVAEIQGAIAYLKGIAKFVHEKGDLRAVSSEKALQLEAIIAGSHAWLCKLEGHLQDLLMEAQAFSDLDTFGTGKTFDNFQSIVSRLKGLSERRALYVTLTTTIALLTSYIDPEGTRFSEANATSTTWDQLMGTLASVLRKKAGEFFKDDVVFNRGSTLSSRRAFVHDEVNYLEGQVGALRSHSEHSVAALNTRKGLTAVDKPVRVAITFDAQGEIVEAGLLSTG